MYLGQVVELSGIKMAGEFWLVELAGVIMIMGLQENESEIALYVMDRGTQLGMTYN